jgi:hypothetical protein
MRASLAFATPRKLPKAASLKGRVVVVDVAFASEAASGGFEKVTKPFIDGLGTRLAAWVDHHDHKEHARYAKDPRFVLATKAEHGACPEMVTPELVKRIGTVDTIMCHTDFDGLCSAAKWMREGVEPYKGADDDARAIDTRVGTPSALADRFDRALRARSRDQALMGIIVRHLAEGLADASLWEPIDAAARELAAIETRTHELARDYRIWDLSGDAGPRSVAFVDASEAHGEYDKTLLLLLGQKRAPMAIVRDRDSSTLAAPFDSGINFLDLLGLSGGMPTLVSIPTPRMIEALTRLGASEDVLQRLGLH